MFYAKRTTIEDLRNRINNIMYLPENKYDNDKNKDYNGIAFSVDYSCSNGDPSSYIDKEIGYKQIGDFAVAFFVADNDDNSIPVSFVLYIDEYNRTHAYTPTEGNSYNTITNTAFGWEFNTSVDIEARKKWLKFARENNLIDEYYDSDEDILSDNIYPYEAAIFNDYIYDNILSYQYDEDKMIENIRQNITVR